MTQLKKFNSELHLANLLLSNKTTHHETNNLHLFRIPLYYRL